MQLWQAIKDIPAASAIAESSVLFPALECVHVVAISIVVGVIAVVDLRLLGFAWLERKVDDLAEELILYTWIAFAVALLSGGLLFASKAPEYVANPMFRAKMLLLVLAAANMAAFHLSAYRTVSLWRDWRKPVLSARLAGGASLLIWVSIVFLGRWIAFAAT